MDWTVSFKKGMLQSQPLVLLNLTLFENRAIIEVIKLKWSQYDWCPYKMGKIGHKARHTQRTCCEDTQGEDGCDGSDASMGQRTPRIVGKHKILEARKGSPLELSDRAWPWFWTSSFQNCETTNFCCFKPPNFWYFIIAALSNYIRFKLSCVGSLEKEWCVCVCGVGVRR